MDQSQLPATPAASPPRRQHSHFDIGLILGDPFALATTSVAIIGWVISFASSVSADVSGSYPQFSWWGLAYQFLLILFIAYIFCLPSPSAFDTYRLAAVGFSAAAIVYSTNSTNNLVYTGRAADAAAAAGCILLSIINIIWVFYFGTTPDAPVHAFVDSYALSRDLAFQNPSSSSSAGVAAAAGTHRSHSNFSTNPSAHAQAGVGAGGMQMYSKPPSRLQMQSGYSPRPVPPPAPPHQQSANQMYTSAQLSGFETASMREPMRSLTYQQQQQQQQQQPLSQLQQLQQQQQQQQQHLLVAQSTGGNTTRAPSDLMEPLDTPTEYPLRARAIYSYDANPEDANEISFVKGEVLEISDVSGRWWQARRANGEVGICPSNYVQLLD